MMDIIFLYLFFTLLLSYGFWNNGDIEIWQARWPEQKKQEYNTAMKQASFLITCISLFFLLLNGSLSKLSLSNLALATAITLVVVAILKTKHKKYLLKLKLSENRVLNYFILTLPIVYILIIIEVKLIFAVFDISF